MKREVAYIFRPSAAQPTALIDPADDAIASILILIRYGYEITPAQADCIGYFCYPVHEDQREIFAYPNVWQGLSGAACHERHPPVTGSPCPERLGVDAHLV
jgi:hypothetical protein